MRLRVVWLALGAACLVWLAGCQTITQLSDIKFSDLKLPDPLAPQASATDDQPTGSTPVEKPGAVTPQLLGANPNDDLNTAKKYFRQGSYGLAERYFRKAVEQHPRDAESWLGLAAAYDRLKRFDLADRAYAQAIRLVGSTPEILNNQGFSYILRGDYRRARAILMEAQAAAPNNPYIKNNLRLLSASERKGKAVN
jgi:Flp pilus assembly protein TadD